MWFLHSPDRHHQNLFCLFACARLDISWMWFWLLQTGTLLLCFGYVLLWGISWFWNFSDASVVVSLFGEMMTTQKLMRRDSLYCPTLNFVALVRLQYARQSCLQFEDSRHWQLLYNFGCCCPTSHSGCSQRAMDCFIGNKRLRPDAKSVRVVAMTTATPLQADSHISSALESVCS